MAPVLANTVTLPVPLMPLRVAEPAVISMLPVAVRLVLAAATLFTVNAAPLPVTMLTLPAVIAALTAFAPPTRLVAACVAASVPPPVAISKPPAVVFTPFSAAATVALVLAARSTVTVMASVPAPATVAAP